MQKSWEFFSLSRCVIWRALASWWSCSTVKTRKCSAMPPAPRATSFTRIWTIKWPWWKRAASPSWSRRSRRRMMSSTKTSQVGKPQIKKHEATSRAGFTLLALDICLEQTGMLIRFRIWMQHDFGRGVLEILGTNSSLWNWYLKFFL